MKVTTKIEECRVPIFQVNFASSSELHWIAVEALLISYAKNINFYRLYMGMIFGRLISYNKDHAEQFTREELDQAAKVSVKFGEYAVYARDAKAELSTLMDRDFLPLGSVSNLIFRGRSKSEAFLETAKLYADISRAQPTDSPVKRQKSPLTTKREPYSADGPSTQPFSPISTVTLSKGAMSSKVTESWTTRF